MISYVYASMRFYAKIHVSIGSHNLRSEANEHNRAAAMATQASIPWQIW